MISRKFSCVFENPSNLPILRHDKIEVENTDLNPDLVEGVVPAKNYDDSDHKYNVSCYNCHLLYTLYFLLPLFP